MSRQFRETFKELFIHRVGRRGSPSLQMVSLYSSVLHSVEIREISCQSHYTRNQFWLIENLYDF